MPTTSVLALPYPAASGANDVPSDLAALATAVEAKLPRGMVSGAKRSSNSAAITTVETTVITSSAFTFLTDRRYEVSLSFELSGSVAGDQFLLQVYDTTTAGTLRLAGRHYVPAAGGPGQTGRTLTTYVDGGWAGAVTPIVTMYRTAGTGNGTMIAGATLLIKDIGPA